jgi:hypothetical protein
MLHAFCLAIAHCAREVDLLNDLWVFSKENLSPAPCRPAASRKDGLTRTVNIVPDPLSAAESSSHHACLVLDFIG